LSYPAWYWPIIIISIIFPQESRGKERWRSERKERWERWERKEREGEEEERERRDMFSSGKC
jgi:hypothetical protein